MIKRINADLKTAMLAKDKLRTETLRLLKSSLQYYKMQYKKDELTDEDVLIVLQKEAKKRRDAIEDALDAGRKDIVENEKAQLRILEIYLPERISEKELDKLIEKIAEQTEAHSMRDMGRLMKTLIAQLKGRADTKVISDKVKHILSK